MRSDEGTAETTTPKREDVEAFIQRHIEWLEGQLELYAEDPDADIAGEIAIYKYIATLTAEVERVRGERDGWERRTKYLGSVVSRAWIVLRGWWHYETEERDDEPFVEALERAVAADRAHDAYSLAEAQKWRDATATARADALIEVREEVGGLLRVENFVEGYGIVDTVILEELTEALDALDATRGETTDPAAPAASPSHSAGAPAGAGESHPAARSPADG